jgi:hypothetical protein
MEVVMGFIETDDGTLACRVGGIPDGRTNVRSGTCWAARVRPHAITAAVTTKRERVTART